MPNVISPDRFYNEQQLKQILPEMEAERIQHREAILKLSTPDTEGCAILSQLYDQYMAQFTGFVRHCRGGLLPYYMRYILANGNRPSPEDPHELIVCYRDTSTKEDIPLAQFAVVCLPDTEEHPLDGAIDEETSREVSESLHTLNSLYLQHLAEAGLEASTAARLFYLPFMTTITSRLGPAQEDIGIADIPVVRSAPPLAQEDQFIPYQFHFDTDNADPKRHFIAVRMAQTKRETPSLAVEGIFRLDALADVAAREAKALTGTPPAQSIH